MGTRRAKGHAKALRRRLRAYMPMPICLFYAYTPICLYAYAYMPICLYAYAYAYA